MEPVLLVVGAVAIAGVVAGLLARLTRDTPHHTATGHRLPGVVDRGDFVRPEAPWLVAVFTSSSCEACTTVAEQARSLESDEVAVQALDVADAPEIHDRYGIDGVPALVLADIDGVVRHGFTGPVTSPELRSVLADLRIG